MAIPNQYQTLAQQIYGRPLEDWEYQNLAGKDVNEVQNILQQSMADYQAAQQQTAPGPGPAPTTQATTPAAQQPLNLYEPGYEKRFGSTPPGAFVVGGGDGRLTPEKRKAMYERDVQQTALGGANLLQDLVNYKPTGASAYGDLYARTQADPSLLRKFHNESDEDALLRLKSNIMDAEQRQGRRQELRNEMGAGNNFVVSGQPYGNLEPAKYGGVGLMGALENMRRIQAQNPQFQGIGSIVSALTGAKEPLALGQQIAPRAPVGGLSDDTGLTPKAQTGQSTDSLLKQLQRQQEAGTAQYWKSGLDTGTATKYMADTMQKYGLKNINDLGVKEVEVPEHMETQYGGGEGSSEISEVFVPASTKKVFYNKATGEEISGPDMDANTGQFGKTYEGKGNTAFRVQFNKETGKPVFYTTQHSSSDLGTIAPMLAMASLIPGVAPFAQGLNALIAAKQGNPLGAVLSGLGAAGGIGSLMGASKDVLSGINTARNVASAANAIKNKDLFGLLSSGANLGGVDLGGAKIAGDITAKDALSGLGAARALQNKDYASLLNIAGQMSKSDNLQTAAKGLAMVNAIKSKNPMKIAQVMASVAGGKKDETPPPKGAGGGLLQGPGFVTVPDNAAVDPRVFSGIASPLLVGSM